MKTETQIFYYLNGEKAYSIYWKELYNCKPQLSSIKAIDLNLEIIVDEQEKLLAYRYDHPGNMLQMVKNNGAWCFSNAAGLLTLYDQFRLRLLCRDYSLN